MNYIHDFMDIRDEAGPRDLMRIINPFLGIKLPNRRQNRRNAVAQPETPSNDNAKPEEAA